MKIARHTFAHGAESDEARLHTRSGCCLKKREILRLRAPAAKRIQVYVALLQIVSTSRLALMRSESISSDVRYCRSPSAPAL